MKPTESFLEQPVRSLQTMLRVISEYDPRIPSVVPDGIYGPGTMRAISTFQRSSGLPVTGITDQDTWDKIVEAYDHAVVIVGKAEPIEILMDPGQIFREGDTGPYIYLMQSMLIWLSQEYTAIATPDHTGIIDAATVSALEAFQQLSLLPQTGELDKNTWKHLVNHYTQSTHHYHSAATG